MNNTRKLLQAAALAFAVLACTPAHAGGILRLGFDSASEIEFSNSSTSRTLTFDVDSGFSGAFELHGAWDNLDLGVGIEIQSWRSLSNHPLGDTYVQFIPVYLTMRLRPQLDSSNVIPYLSLQAGMAMFRADDNITGNGFLEPRAGAHFGVGGGVILGKDFLLELMITRDTGSLERNGTTVSDVAYSKVTFGFGIYFK